VWTCKLDIRWCGVQGSCIGSYHNKNMDATDSSGNKATTSQVNVRHS
jgi:hypothetical protein